MDKVIDMAENIKYRIVDITVWPDDTQRLDNVFDGDLYSGWNVFVCRWNAKSDEAREKNVYYALFMERWGRYILLAEYKDGKRRDYR